MTIARDDIVNLDERIICHCCGRCVRRAFLCGDDPDTEDTHRVAVRLRDEGGQVSWNCSENRCVSRVRSWVGHHQAHLFSLQFHET